MAARATISQSARERRSIQSPPLVWSGWTLFLACIGTYILCLVIYSPATHGPFVFDDLALPFSQPYTAKAPLIDWISGVRPTLMLSYWLSYQSAGTSTSSYHLFNVLVHGINSILVWLVAFRIFMRAGIETANRVVLASLSAFIFLLHPLQTESVAYIAGRSESLAACFFLAAYVIFLYRRREAASWPVSFGVFFFFVLAVTTKENMLILPAALVLTDLFWNRTGAWLAIRANWRLYGLIAGAAAMGILLVWRTLSHATSAGFRVPGVEWYQYLFTETRAIFSYLRLFLFPVGQSADHDFPLSHTLLEHGALFSIAALMACIAAAVVFRKRFPLASFGFLLFLLLLAPTSSIIPINDAFVERRMYLPVLALCFIIANMLAGRDLRNFGVAALLALVLCVFAAASYQRNKVWSDVRGFWADTVTNSPGKSRAYWAFAETAVAQDHCDEPVPYLQKADTFMPGDPYILASWAKVLGCKGKFADAIRKLKEGEKKEPSAAIFYALEGLLYGQMDKLDESKAALDKAIQLDPRYVVAYSSRGLWYEAKKEYVKAIADYHAALQIDPMNGIVRVRLARAQAAMKNSLSSGE